MNIIEAILNFAAECFLLFMLGFVIWLLIASGDGW